MICNSLEFKNNKSFVKSYLSKDSKFLWTNECQKCFDTLKQYLIWSPILAIYNPNEECILFTDASKIGLGAVVKKYIIFNLNP